MPVRVPDGTYTAKVELDMGSYFGLLKKKTELTIKNPGDDALKKRISELSSSDVKVRRFAANDIYHFGDEAKEAVDALCKALKDPDAEVKRAACWSLGWIGKNAETALRHLIETLKDDD